MSQLTFIPLLYTRPATEGNGLDGIQYGLAALTLTESLFRC